MGSIRLIISPMFIYLLFVWFPVTKRKFSHTAILVMMIIYFPVSIQTVSEKMLIFMTTQDMVDYHAELFNRVSGSRLIGSL